MIKYSQEFAYIDKHEHVKEWTMKSLIFLSSDRVNIFYYYILFIYILIFINSVLAKRKKIEDYFFPGQEKICDILNLFQSLVFKTDF